MQPLRRTRAHFHSRRQVCFIFTLSLLLLSTSTKLEAQFFKRVLDAGPIVTDSVRSSAISWNDYNNDGYLDLYTSESTPHMYRNLGNGTFAAVDTGHFITPPAPSPFGTVAAVWADFDNDGLLDLYRANFSTFDSRGNPQTPLVDFLYKNEGPPHYNLRLVSLDNESTMTPTCTWVDYDNDGDVDLFATGALGTPDLFYRNEGNGQFTRVPDLAFIARRNVGVHDSWIDYDNDGDEDVFFVNQGAPNLLYKNLLGETGTPGMFEATAELADDGSLFDIAASWGDYDNDGDSDVFISFSGPFGSGAPDRLYRNEGNGAFTRITTGAIVAEGTNSSFGAWGDYDNDGDLDLFVAQVALRLARSNLYRNEGNGAFTKMSQAEVGDIIIDLPAPQAGAWGDYDNDGDLDMMIANFAQPNNITTGVPQPNYLIRNEQGNAQHWLIVRAVGSLSNRSAIGAKIKAKATMRGRSSWQMRTLIGGTTGHTAQPDPRAHFGLGEATTIDSLLIIWPSGVQQTLTQISANQILTVTEAVPNGFVRADFSADARAAFNADSLTVQFTDRSFALPNAAIASWAWDFDDDGVIDARAQHPRWTYARADTYAVRLTVANGIQTVSKQRTDFIKVSGALSLISVDTKSITLANLSASTARVDTSFYVRNNGKAGDSIFVTLDAQNVAPVSALAVSPQKFRLAAGDSQRVTFTIFPSAITSQNTILRPKVIVDAQRAFGAKHFEKSFVLRVLSTAVQEPRSAPPQEFKLLQNHPNPFHPATQIQFELPRESWVELRVYDVMGKEIKTLQANRMRPGSYHFSWEGTNNLGERVVEGVYLYVLRARLAATGTIGFAQTRKMLLRR